MRPGIGRVHGDDEVAVLRSDFDHSKSPVAPRD